MRECPCCKRSFDDETKPLTTLRLSVSARVAEGDVVLRSHIVDRVQAALLEWMHEDTYTSLTPSDDEVELLNIVIAR